ncbi:chemotaxis protein CheW [Lysobacter sp. D1-1-M9]|uniref:chemotaxis protein CheW n=1 Tax=Novilysobacter longmucuonensis TaxID=3098603 RepID=UPI002FCBDB41
MPKHNKKNPQAPRQPTASGTTTPAAHAPAAPPPTADIRGVLIQIAGARLLLPNATIAEVLSYAPPEPIGEAAPDWLLGRIRWRGWQLPLVAFSQLAGIGPEQAGLGSKVIVLKALGGDAKAPYFAMLTQGFPRLVTVSRDGLVVDNSDQALPQGVQSRVMLNQDDAFVPDLEAIETLVGNAIAQAA